MNDNDIKKCKKNRVVWLDNLGIVQRVAKHSCLWPQGTEWGLPSYFATRAAAQAAIDERKFVESHETPVGETQPKEVATAEIQKPTTVRGWLETIPDPAIREAAIRQCADWSMNCTNLAGAITYIWNWGYTDEGPHFWSRCLNAASGTDQWPSYPPKAKQLKDDWTDDETEKAAFKGRTFQTGAKRDADDGKPRMDLIPPELMIALGNVFRDGAAHYGEHNWEKGIPLNQHIASLLRHVVAIMVGDHSENHDEKMAANVAMFIATARRIEAGKLPRELDTIGWCK